MMQAGDRKQGINKCWPNHSYVTNFTNNQTIASYMCICILSVCCVSSLSYRCLPHISNWPQAARNCPLQDVYCSHMPEKILSPATTRERPPPERAHIISSTQPWCWEEGQYFCLYVKLPLTSTAGGSQCSAQAVNSVWDCVPQICQCSARAVLCSCCQ